MNIEVLGFIVEHLMIPAALLVLLILMGIAFVYGIVSMFVKDWMKYKEKKARRKALKDAAFEIGLKGEKHEK